MRPPEPKMSRLQAWALRLNRRQIRALVLGLSVATIFAVRPYWYFIRFNELGGKTRVPAGFNFVSTPPIYGSEIFRAEAHVDWTVFAIIESVCIGATIASVFGLRDRNNEASTTYGQYR